MNVVLAVVQLSIIAEYQGCQEGDSKIIPLGTKKAPYGAFNIF